MIKLKDELKLNELLSKFSLNSQGYKLVDGPRRLLDHASFEFVDASHFIALGESSL